MRLEECTEAIKNAIEHILQPGKPLRIAIDGRCASGKTTVAAALQSLMDVGVFHMDDFFLRPEQRTPERLALPGENVDHERFRKEVLLPLEYGEAITYRPFNCRLQQLSSPIRVNPKQITLIEGAYSCHPQLWDHYDLRIFMTVNPEEQLRRIRIRNGEAAEIFREKWIPLEEKYFSAFRIETRCDILLKID